MPLNLKPSHKSVEAYYHSLAKFDQLGITHETAVRSAFQELLGHCAHQFGWKLVPEYKIKRKGRNPLSADGALLDDFNCQQTATLCVRVYECVHALVGNLN